MAAEVKKEIQLEIAHVRFLDIVGYSKLSVNEQHARASDGLRRLGTHHSVLRLPGDLGNIWLAKF